jgi:hypothetical protein
MKKTIFAVTLLAVAAAGNRSANAGGIRFGLNFALPLPVPVFAPPVAYVAPAPVVVYAPAPSYYAPAPVYCPPPAVVYRSPVCVEAPRVYLPPVPVFDFRFRHEEHRHFRHDRR